MRRRQSACDAADVPMEEKGEAGGEKEEGKKEIAPQMKYRQMKGRRRKRGIKGIRGFRG